MRETVPLSSSPAGMLTVLSAHHPSPSHHGTGEAGRRVFYSDRVLTPSPSVNKSRQTGTRSVVIFNWTAEGVWEASGAPQSCEREGVIRAKTMQGGWRLQEGNAWASVVQVSPITHVTPQTVRGLWPGQVFTHNLHSRSKMHLLVMRNE